MAEERDFLEQQRRAVERMNEMYRRQQMNSVSHKMPATPDFVKLNTESVHSKTDYANKTQGNNQTKNTADEPKPNNDKKTPENRPKNNRQPSILEGILGGVNLPFKNGGKLDGDITLILGILLILASEKADRKLLLALLYILI